MAKYPIFLFVALLFVKTISTADIVEREHAKLDRNLKVIRKDFNKFVENIEDFVGDFLKQVQEADPLFGNGFSNDEDYNWQDKTLLKNTIKPTFKETEVPILTTTESTTPKPMNPWLKLQQQKLLSPEFMEENEITNEIEKTNNRKKRSIAPNTLRNNVENRPSAPMILMNNGQKQFAPMQENTQQRLPVKLMEPRNPIVQGSILGAPKIIQQHVPCKDTKDNTQPDPRNCTTKTQTEINMEKEKLEQLKTEVKKLNDLTALLKDQQNIINAMDGDAMGMENKEGDNGLNEESIEESFLYKTMKQLENRKKDRRTKSGQTDVSHHMQDQPYKTIISDNKTNQEIKELDLQLHKTAESLNKTQILLIKGKEKEDLFERELKRQNSELKFLKVMMENLYDKSNLYQEFHNTEKSSGSTGLRNSDFKDMDIDSIVGEVQVHTPKPWPNTFHFPIKHQTTDSLKRQSISSEENDRRMDSNQKVSIKERFGQSSMRESTPTENKSKNLHRFLTVLDEDKNAAENGPDTLTNHQDQRKESQTDTMTRETIDKETDLSQTSRASANSKNDGNLKSKLLELLTKEDRSDDIDNKEKTLSDAMKKLLQPESKSDDDVTIDALMSLVKSKRGPPKTTQDSLSKLLRDLNSKPQSKTDDSEVEEELRQLQRAINGLKPKEDNFDLGNNVGKSSNQDFQSMLSQIIAQNGPSSNSFAAQSLPIVPNTGINSAFTQPQLSNQYGIPANTGSQTNAHGNSYASQLAALQELMKSQSVSHQTSNSGSSFSPNSNSYGSNSNTFGSNSFPYAPSSIGYGSNSNFNSGSNLYGSAPSSASYGNSYGSSLNALSPALDDYSFNFKGPYTPDNLRVWTTPDSPNSYGPFNSGVNSNTYSGNLNDYSSKYNYANAGRNLAYGGPSNNYLGPDSTGPFSKGKYQSPIQQSYGNSKYNFGNSNQGFSSANLGPYSTSAHSFGNIPPKPTSYQFEGHPGNNQGLNGYHSGPNIGNDGYSGIATQGYTPAGANGFSEVNNGHHASHYGESLNAGNDVGYKNMFFHNPGGASAGDYQGYNSGSKGYSGPGMDQSYGNTQNSNQHKYDMISDLNQQIQYLENSINGLSKGDGYSHTADDTATITGLEQRIYELKGVVNNLKQPSYHSQSSNAAYTQPPNNPLYGSAQQPSADFNQNQPSFNAPQPAYGSNGSPAYTISKPQSGSVATTSSQGQYQPSASSPNQAATYEAGSIQPSAAASYLPPNALTYQSPAQAISSPIQSSQIPSAPPPTSYQSNPQGDSPQGSAPYQAPLGQSRQSSSSFRAKESGREDKKVGSEGASVRTSEGSYQDRRKREIEVGQVQVPPMARRPEGDAAINIGLRQMDGGNGQSVNNYDGEDSITKIANLFQRYLVETPTEPKSDPQLQYQEPLGSQSRTTNQQNRNSALDSLQSKLNDLKYQLESQQQSQRSLPDFFGPPRIAAQAPLPYDRDSYFPTTLYNDKSFFHEDKGLSIFGKKTDLFDDIFSKIIEKIFRVIPSILGKIIGKLLFKIGDSYGDSYSPLQSVLGNLGFIGYFPLILVKIMESAGIICKYLRKIPFFKKFLIPVVVLGVVAVSILFLIFFYDKDEPYGYIGYQGHPDSYPTYEPSTSSSYGHQDSLGTNSKNYYGRSNVDGKFYGNDNEIMSIPFYDNIKEYDGTFDLNNNGPNYGNSPPWQSANFFDKPVVDLENKIPVIAPYKNNIRYDNIIPDLNRPNYGSPPLDPVNFYGKPTNDGRNEMAHNSYENIRNLDLNSPNNYDNSPLQPANVYNKPVADGKNEMSMNFHGNIEKPNLNNPNYGNFPLKPANFYGKPTNDGRIIGRNEMSQNSYENIRNPDDLYSANNYDNSPLQPTNVYSKPVADGKNEMSSEMSMNFHGNIEKPNLNNPNYGNFPLKPANFYGKPTNDGRIIGRNKMSQNLYENIRNPDDLNSPNNYDNSPLQPTNVYYSKPVTDGKNEMSMNFHGNIEKPNLNNPNYGNFPLKPANFYGKPTNDGRIIGRNEMFQNSYENIRNPDDLNSPNNYDNSPLQPTNVYSKPVADGKNDMSMNFHGNIGKPNLNNPNYGNSPLVPANFYGQPAIDGRHIGGHEMPITNANQNIRNINLNKQNDGNSPPMQHVNFYDKLRGNGRLIGTYNGNYYSNSPMRYTRGYYDDFRDDLSTNI